MRITSAMDERLFRAHIKGSREMCCPLVRDTWETEYEISTGELAAVVSRLEDDIRLARRRNPIQAETLRELVADLRRLGAAPVQ